ncbi:MAG TPA: 30S ribosomal protein S20 [Deltaproteobacteria bacterium]|nr:30S ribosomal protein S20 [Deltaproteobacteria bacterium]
MAEDKKKGKLPKGRHRSQIKRHKQNLKRAERNLTIRSEVRSFIKKVRQAVEKKDAAQAKQALLDAIRKIDKAVSKGILHAKNRSRKVSRLSKLVGAIKS